jgi:two-component system cell cycle response regulator
MTARVLIVDDLRPNIRMLETRLLAEYFEVVSANSGQEALTLCRDGKCDIVLLDVMMPGLNGFEVCRRLKADPLTLHLPVLIVTALDQPSDRLRGLEAGADDFLIKPVDEIALIARVRSLTRLKVALDELRARAVSSAEFGLTNPFVAPTHAEDVRGRILLVEDRPASAERIVADLRDRHEVVIETQPQEALFRAAETSPDLVIVSLDLENFDALRLCSQLRSLERTRTTPVLALAGREERTRILRGLDLGVNDYVLRPVDRNELIARVRTQLRRKRYVDALRDNVQNAIELAAMDPLTGLGNRRFFEKQLAEALERAAHGGRSVSLMMIDVDHFKQINDQYGHEAGDHVLRSLAQRIKGVLRRTDPVCRYGGEEFLALLPDTPLVSATRVAERVRTMVESTPFRLGAGSAQLIPVTISIGLAERGDDANAEALLRRTDRALYASKTAGRNRVTVAAA